MLKTEQKKKVLYISYDGIMEPLGYSQVLKYLEHLSTDFDITLISYEKSSSRIINKDFFSDDDTLFIFFNWIERIKNIDVVDTFYVKAIGDFSNPFNYELEGYIFSKEEVLKFSNESFIVQGQNYYFPQGWFTKFQGFAGIGIKSVEEFMNGDRNYSETDNPHTFNVLLEEHNESYQVEIDIAKLEK